MATLQLSENIFAGIQFNNAEYGTMVITSETNPTPIGEYKSYNRALAVGVAQKFNEELSAGIQLRITQDKFPQYSENSQSEYKKNFLFGSIGATYQPNYCNRRLYVGLSLMNIGSTISFVDASQQDPPPSVLRIGTRYALFKESVHHFDVGMEAERSVARITEKVETQNTFTGIFDWKKFPQDVSLHSHVSWQWNALDIGNDISFFQEMYNGVTSYGKEYGGQSVFTQGVRIGFGYKDINISCGFAGMWHATDDNFFNFRFYRLPDESYDFSLRFNNSLFTTEKFSADSHTSLKKIILTLGAGYTFRTGWASEQIIYESIYTRTKTGYSNSALYTIEAAMYFDEQSALVSSLVYSRIPVYLLYEGLPSQTSQGFSSRMEFRIESVSLFSLYRYHPIQRYIAPLFVEVGFGIQRLNSIEDSYPLYRYQTTVKTNIGAVVPLISGIVIIPKIDFNTMLARINGSSPRLGGYNQWEYGIQIGYVL